MSPLKPPSRQDAPGGCLIANVLSERVWMSALACSRQVASEISRRCDFGGLDRLVPVDAPPANDRNRQAIHLSVPTDLTQIASGNSF